MCVSSCGGRSLRSRRSYVARGFVRGSSVQAEAAGRWELGTLIDKVRASTLPVVVETMGAVDAYETEQRPWGATGAEAVELCHRWMLRLGATDTVIAGGSANDVCDLYSSRYLAWVESRRGNLDLGVVERAAAVSSSDGRAPLVFVAGGVLPTVQDRADVLAVGLLRFDARAGNLDGANDVGRRVIVSGLLGG